MRKMPRPAPATRRSSPPPTLATTARWVQLLDLGATKGAHVGQEGWVTLLDSRPEVKNAGTVGHTSKVGEGEVTVFTGQTIEHRLSITGDVEATIESRVYDQRVPHVKR
jgi:hypothetical protein